SVVSSSGVFRFTPGLFKSEQPGFCEECVGPASMVAATESDSGSLLLLAQDGAQPSSNHPVECPEGVAMGMLEVAEPASEQWVEIGDDTRKTRPARPSRLGPDAVLEAGKALLAYPAPSGFEPVAEELEAFPRLPTIAEMGLHRTETQAIVRYPLADFRQGGFGPFAALS